MRPFTLVSYLDANDRSRPGFALGDTMIAWSDLATAHGLPLAEATMPELIAAWPMLEPRTGRPPRRATWRRCGRRRPSSAAACSAAARTTAAI
jgi:hypothetical protein